MDEYLRCDNCGHVFSNKSNLRRHKNTVQACFDKDVAYKCPCGRQDTRLYYYNQHIANCVIYDYEKKLAELKDKNLELNEEINMQAVEIDKLKKQLIELKIQVADGGGQIKVYEKRPTTQNVIKNSSKTTNARVNYINPKLLTVKCDTIRPFTIETVKEDVASGAFTYEHFIRGAKGIADFIERVTTHEDQRSYVCTDSSRSKFHRLLESRKWKDDNGATFISSVFDELADAAGKYYEKILDRASAVPDEGEDDDRDFNDMLLQRVKPVYFALTDKKSSVRAEVLNKVRNEVKKLAAV